MSPVYTWEVATNATRGVFAVGSRSFVDRTLTRAERRKVSEAQPGWKSDDDFLLWALNLLKREGEGAPELSWLDETLTDEEQRVLVAYLLEKFGFRTQPREVADATATS